MNRVYPPGRGATGRILRDAAKQFVREGWHVTILTSGKKSGEFRDGAIKVVRVKGADKPAGVCGYFLVWVRMFFAALREERQDVVMSMSDPPMLAVVGALVARFKKCRHVHWCQDVYPEVLPALGMNPPGFVMRALVWMRRRAMLGSDLVVVCGRCMAAFLCKDGVEENKLAVVPNWAEIELVHPDAAECVSCDVSTQDTRPFEEQVKGRPRFRVMYAGNLGLVHPVEVLIDAAERLQKDAHDVELVFVGDGERFDWLAEERSKRGLDNIRFLPYQPVSRLREVLESGDMHLVTLDGHAGGFVVPCKFYAAMAVERPCIFIGPQDCEAARVIRDYKAGVVIPQGDVSHLVASIILFRKNGDAWFEAHRGAARVRGAFTREASLDMLVDKVSEVAKHGK